MRTPSEALVRVTADGEVQVESGGTDIGTGLYTICAQTAAEVLGVEAADAGLHVVEGPGGRAQLVVPGHGCLPGRRPGGGALGDC